VLALGVSAALGVQVLCRQLGGPSAYRPSAYWITAVVKQTAARAYAEGYAVGV
jgi:hypothetical protein